MDLKTLLDTPPWDWPERAGKMFCEILRDESWPRAFLSPFVLHFRKLEEESDLTPVAAARASRPLPRPALQTVPVPPPTSTARLGSTHSCHHTCAPLGSVVPALPKRCDSRCQTSPVLG